MVKILLCYDWQKSFAPSVKEILSPLLPEAREGRPSAQFKACVRPYHEDTGHMNETFLYIRSSYPIFYGNSRVCLSPSSSSFPLDIFYPTHTLCQKEDSTRKRYSRDAPLRYTSFADRYGPRITGVG